MRERWVDQTRQYPLAYREDLAHRQDRSEPPVFRGVAAVPSAPLPPAAEDDTGEVPVVGDGRATPPRRGVAGPAEPPRGLVVRRRGRQLRAGGEWTTTGLLFALVCWGIWVISLRGNDLTGPVLLMVLVLVTAGFVFALSRLLGRLVLERGLGRQRRSAWPSHLAAGGYLTIAGIGFLQQTQWVVEAWSWLWTMLP